MAFESVNTLAEKYATTKDRAIRDTVVDQLQPYIRKLAHSYCKDKPAYRFDPHEVTSSANLGLLKALERFEPNHGKQFMSYLTTRAIGQIIDDARSSDPFSRHTVDRVKAVERAKEDHYKQTGDRMTEDDVLALRKPGDNPTRHAKFVQVHESIRDKADPVREVANRDLWRRVTKGMSRRDRMIFTAYYRDGMTMEDIGPMVGLSESMVSYSLKALRKFVKSTTITPEDCR